MAAVLAIAVFLFAAAIGLAVILAFEKRPASGMLLQAPALGFALVMMVTTTLNRAGLPVRSFARILAALLLLLAVAYLVRRKPWNSLVRLWPFAAVLVPALFLIGRPLFEFGFAWLSFGNHDMVNYCLNAERFVVEGWSHVPDPGTIASDRDTRQLYWIFDVVVGERYGVDELLAFVRALAGLSAFAVFMPAILAMTLALICATCGLVYRSEDHRVAAVLAGALLAVNAEFALGTLSQLLGQVGGLMMLCASVALGFELGQADPRTRLKRAVLVGIALSGLLYAYPEALPFFVGAVLLHVLLTMRSSGVKLGRATLAAASVGLGVVFLLVNTYALTVFVILTTRGVGASDPSRFPYYLLPTGLANVTGVLAQGTFPTEPLGSIYIVVGGVAVALGVYAVVKETWRREPVAYVAAVMLILTAYLFAHRAAFALLKIAMYLQPFLSGAVALLVARALAPHWRRANAVPPT